MNQKIKNYINNLSEPKIFKKVMYGCGILFITFFIFEAGMFIGFHKASFRHDFDDNFSRNFGPRYRGGMMESMPENFPNSHGVIGKIIKIELPTLIVADKDSVEKVVVIKDDTKIRYMREEETKDQLKLDDAIVVIGVPNQKGQIEAKLIRVLPYPKINTAK